MTKIFLYAVYLCFIICQATTSFASSADTTFSFLTFTENSGQWDRSALFRSKIYGGAAFLERSGFSWLFYPSEGMDILHGHTHPREELHDFHVVKMKFLNSEESVVVSGKGKQTRYENFFLHNKGIGNAAVYSGVGYENIYNGIDMRILGEENNFRYDFIIQPGADVSAIKCLFTGQDKLEIIDGNLFISTKAGLIKQTAPVAWQIINGQKKKVSCYYSVNGNILGYGVSSYDKSKELIIDPTLVFATFTGSTADNWGMTATNDQQGNGYTAGITFNPGYPVTAGAIQFVYGGGQTNTTFPFGGFDITISKFSSNGNSMLYATYLGGSNNEMPASIITDNAGNLYLMGKTYSSDFPVTSGAYDVSYNGGADIVVCKINPSGTVLLGSTFVGGSLDDGVNIDAYEPTLASLKHNYSDDGRGEIQLDNNGSVLVGNCTKSTDFPVTPGCFRSVNAGMQDGCLFKLDAGLSSMLFSTYIGGSQNDAVYAVVTDSYGNPYVCGGTESSDFPVTAGALSTSYSGGIDGFVSSFSSSGNSLTHSSYIGTTSYDQVYFVQTDPDDNVYLFGQTAGAYPVSPGVYSNPSSGQFIHKLDPTLSVTDFSTVIGNSTGRPNIVPSAFLVDQCRNIYLSGWGGPLASYFATPVMSTNGMSITPDAFQPTTDGSDFYFMVLTKGALALKYATYFGGSTISEHVDGGTSRFDKSGAIYQGICGGCGGQSGMPTTPGVWSPHNGSANCNNALVKFSFDMEITVAQLATNPSVASGCAPFVVTFLNSSVNSIQYQWDFGDGTLSSTTAPVHTFSNPGTYDIMLIAIDSSTCNIRDTTYSQILVFPPVSVDPMPPIQICLGDSFQLQATVVNASVFQWQPPAGLNNTAILNPEGYISSAQIYTITVGNNGCTDTASVLVHVNTNEPEIIPDVAQLCNHAPTQLTADTAYAAYLWFNGSASAVVTVSDPGTYFLQTTDFYGCIGYDTLVLESYSYVDFSGYDTSMCSGSSVQLSGPAGEYSYLWAPPAGLSSTTVVNPVASPIVSTTYTLSVSYGPCITTDTVFVEVMPLPPLEIAASQTTVLPGETIDLVAVSDTVAYWNPPRQLSCTICNYTIATPDTIQTYYATVYNQWGCQSTDSITVYVEPVLYIPNAFTPNTDIRNPVFRPECIGYVSIDVYIFNRWGEEIYHWNTFDGGWDGTYQGKKVQEDVYIYKLRATDFRDNEIEKAGTVTLIR